MTTIRQTLVRQESIDIHFEDGKSVTINSDQRRLHLHFSGLGDKVVRPGEFGANTFDINYVDWERRADHKNDPAIIPLLTTLKSDVFHSVRRFVVKFLKDAGNLVLADWCLKSVDFVMLRDLLVQDKSRSAEQLRAELMPLLDRFSAPTGVDQSQGG